MNCSVGKTARKVNTDRTNWDVDAQANIEQVSESVNEKVKANNYSSVAWRNEAVLHSAVFGAKVLDKVRRQRNQKIEGSMKSFLKNAICIELNNVVAARIAREKGISKEEIKKQLGYDESTGLYSGNVGYVSEMLKGTSESNDNIIAWYNEAFDDRINENTGISYANEFFNSVFANQKLGSVRFDKNDTFGEYALSEALSVTDENDISDPENGDNPVDTDDSNTIAAFDHSGEHKDFMIGVDQDIKTYFDTLNKLKSPEKAGKKWQLDKENLYEIVNVMDARSCSSVLYHQGDFTDDASMVESIKRIARQCAGFEAFMKFAEDLENDADFRYKVYNSFAKRIMSKLETVVDDKNGKPNLANKRSNAVTALSFEFRNTIKSTAVSVNNYEMEDKFEELDKYLRLNPDMPYSQLLHLIATQPDEEHVLKYIGDLTNLLQTYYPTIDRYGIANYLYNATDANGKINVSANLSNLTNILKRTIQASKRTAVAYNSLQYDIATEKNKKKRQALYNVDYVDNANNQEAQALAELLAPYSVVRVDLNSRNTEGKLSSDVLNNNFLTNFINTLQSSLNRKFRDSEGNVTYAQDCPIQHFKEFKFKSTQYNLSNILVEKVEDGKVVNRGLFRKEGNGYVPTEYATDLLRISKFNGATSFDNGKNTLYSKMSKADYITTAFINFFNTDGSINGTPMANYFMRIPSDSGTQFVVTAPRYIIAQSGNNALRNPDGKINKNHPLFKQFRYAFLQELVDMGDAINIIFVTDENGVVTRAHKNGKDVLQFNPGFENKPTSKLYKKYHYNGTVVATDSNGNEYLTGNVFKSNRFTVVKADGTEVNYGQIFLDDIVDFLYGGGIATDTKESVKFVKENGRVVAVNLDAQSDKFREALDNMIENFIADYTKEAISRIQGSKNFIKSSNASLIGEDKDNKEFNRKVSEFVLNTHLMYINFDDLFEGNSKFYGSAQDFLKRAKEVQGSGVPYGIVNYNNNFTITAKTPKEGALLNSKEVIDRIGNIGQYDSFRAVTIVNTVRTPIEAEYKKADGSGKDGVLVKKLSQNFATQAGRKRPNENDKQRARNMMAGFAGAKVNDAQSYITFEEWVRRIAARGQLMKHLPLIEKIQKGETLTDTEMDAFVQVQKNFYYDQYYDEQTGVIVPRQIKNAEFVLVPQFIKGTQLEQIYNLMKKHDIDQLNTEETSKAGKHNVLTLWDNEGNLTQKNLDDFDAKADGAAEYFNYNYLYTQQETPQHVNAENKAGIQIMKKIIDNIPVGHKLYPVKQKFMELYSANVQSAFNTLMSELNVETDENGYPILNEDGQIKGLDYKKLYDMFREEAERLGVDSNLSDYFTLDEQVLDNVAQTLMPNFFSNVSSRVESVAQALFNSRITRQKLPGFHGAQVTQIGFKKENIQTSDALRYHSRLTEDGKEVYSPYIEVMLPKSNFGLSEYDDATALKMLQEAGADELIGYRIPTEGKQSVGVMKVVGFTNDAQGSTIIVPDGWVPQTGSDFDIDSIYGIQWHMYVGKDGKLKVPFMSTSEEDVTKRWHSYIARNVEVPNAFENIDQDLAEYRETIENKETFTEFAEVQRAAGEAFLELNGRFKALVAQINRDFKDDNDKASYKEHLQNLINKLEEEIAKPQYARGVWRNAEGKTLTDKEFDKLSEEEQEEYDWVHGNRDTVLEVSDYVQSLKDIVNFLDTQAEVNVAYSKIKQVTEFLHATQDRLYEDAAKDNGLMSLEEFSKLDINMQNSKTARDNEILNCMMTILKDDSSLEENLGRSNFDDISNTDEDNLGAIQKMMSPTERSRRQKRSPYNFFDQADYQDDAMSGAKLKGFSVTRDNLCSVCNTVRPVVKTDAYIMLYDATKYDIKQLKETFGEQNVNLSRDKKYIQVRHKTFGWSRNNKNVVGRILTSYSSETTAHILDAIKEGAAPNVNDFTFAVYKSFVDVGSDYDTAIGFMAQPAVSRIVSAYNNNKSIFTGFNTNPIQQAIRSLAGEIGIKTTEKKGKTTKGVSLNKIVKAINENEELGKAFEELFGVKLDIKSIKGNEAEFENFALPTYLLKDRIDESGVFASSPVEENADKAKLTRAAFDLGILLKYFQYAQFSQRIGDVARVMNPDKFGAKKNIYETSKVFDDIQELIDKGDMPLVVRTKQGEVISILEAVYPGIGDGDVETFMKANPERKSAYPPLYSFLKYATAPSVVINRTLFETQNEDFVKAVNMLEVALGFGSRISEKQYTDYQKYILGEIYSEIPFIKHPVVFNAKTNTFDVDINVDKQDEVGRIYGFNRGSGFTAPVKTKALRTIAEVRKYAREHTLEDFVKILPKEVINKANFDESKKYDSLVDEELISYITNDLINAYSEYLKNNDIYKFVDTAFEIKNIYKPTNKELEVWQALSPAQKVLWIQQNAKNPGIFGLFKVDLRNDNRDGSQTIEFAEDSVNIEDAYSMFNNAFYNENPLIRLAAADLIKYSFVVEGFQMSQHAVNKVIRNTPLMQSIEEGGTGIVSYMRDAVRDVRHRVNTKEALMRYVRSHDVQGMPKVKINDLNPRALVDENNWETYTEVENGQKVERQRHPSTGVLIIQLNDNNIATLIENNMIQILDNGDIDYCSFFKTTGRKGKTYRLEIKDGVAYAYPLNKLQPNEHTEWSTRLENNEQPSAEYFEAIIDGRTDTSKKADFMSPITYKVQRVATFEMLELKDNSVSKINNASSEILKGNAYYLWSPELSTKLPRIGDMTTQEIDGVVYDIMHVKADNVQKKYLGENKDVTIASRDVAYNDLINNPNYGLRAMGFKKPSLDIFQVKAHKSVEVVITPEEMMSDTTEDLGELSVYAIFDNAAQGDRIAEDARRMLSERGINKENPVGSTEDGLFIISNYLNRVVDRINDQLQHFQTEDGRVYKVTDPELIDYIRNNPEERRRYLKLLLDARKIKRQFESYSAFDTSSHDPMLKRYLDNIKKKVVELDEALTSNGLELFANDYLAKVSSNPLLKWNNKLESDIITLLDGFYGSGMIEAMINDTQEMPNPLIQIITKEVMADIRAKEMAAEERVSEFEKTVATIKKEAESAGMSINWDNIVDKTGKLIQPYKDSFIDDYAALRKNVEDIKNTRLPDGTIDYKALNKAQLALDKWLNDNVELALKGDTKDEFGLPIKSFYTKKIELEQNMINNHEEIFARYKALLAKRRDIVSHLNTNDSDPRWEKELRDVDLELKGLTASMNYDPDSHTFSSKTGKELEDAKALSNYKADIKKLYDEYYDKEENAGFREDLEENLRIVKEAERRDKYGVPQASQEELKHNERYQQAATWLKKNAIFSPDPEVYEKVNAAFRALRNGSKKSKTSEILKLVATNADAYDVKGRVDGRKLNVEQQRNLTKTQQEEYNNQANADSVAASLINSAGEVDEVYTKDFYKLLYREGYAKSAEYKAKVKEINDILSQHYGNSKTINWVDMTTDELNNLANLYRELREIKEDIEFSWSSRYAKLHSENIDYIINQENFDIARNAAELAGMDMNLWDAVNTEFVTEAGKKVRKPNRLIYGKAVPTAEARAKKNAKTGKLIYIDEAKTEALKTIRGYMVTEPSEYYFEEYARRKKEGVDADGRTFEEWYADNHVYNPYSRTMIPNRSWMVSRLNDANEGTWEPGFNQTHSIPKEEYKNPNHKDGISLGINYKDNGGKYKNDVHQNEYEKKLQAKIYDLLMALAKVETAKRFFEEGNMPIMSKDEEHDLRFYLKEAAKGVGWIEDTNTGKEFDENINYANDYIPSMPMTAKLRDVKIEAKKPEKPEFKEGDDVDEYNKKLDEYNKALAKYEAEREKYNQDQLNRNWEEVIKRFIKEAAHYNAVQDNRLMLYYGQEILKNQMMYDTNLGKSNLKIDDRKSKGKKVVYQTRDSKREYEQYTNWLRRLMFNQWKHNNPRWTRWANLMQSFTSANFMMMNIRGGIANVTLGETQILAEAFAKEYFGTKEYLKGKAIWMSNVPDYLAHMYDEKSSTVAGALIKFMNVVDFDEWTGVVHADLDPATYLKRARDMMFSPQTMGEHFMQNGAMFSIMLSHRLYENKNPELNGKTKYIVKGRAEVIRDAHEDALFEILKDNEALKKEFEEFRKSQLSDDNVRKEFAWFRKDMTTEFMERLDKDKQKKFIELRKDFEKKALEDFDKQPDVMSQFKLGDNGKLAFADGSILFQLNNSAETNSDVNDAYKILGALKGRVISVNKKIHGVYDRMGSAQLEKYWWGALAMQYHKHIYPGIMKRYRKHGYYNEERGTIEKGCYNALIDFLAIPIRKYRQDMKDNEVTGMEGLQNLFKHVADFCLNVNTHWNLLPDYERANIARNLGDVCGVLAAVAVAIGLRALGDDDDEDGIIYNLCLYEADRLASESFQFNPYGAWVEAKKLWSNPVAVQSIINDILSSMGTMSQILIEGEDYDPYYKSGKYAHQHKLKVYIERRIPVWRGINAIVNIADDNHYYKLGDNMLNIIPVKDIAEWIKE